MNNLRTFLYIGGAIIVVGIIGNLILSRPKPNEEDEHKQPEVPVTRTSSTGSSGGGGNLSSGSTGSVLPTEGAPISPGVSPPATSTGGSTAAEEFKVAQSVSENGISFDVLDSWIYSHTVEGGDDVYTLTKDDCLVKFEVSPYLSDLADYPIRQESVWIKDPTLEYRQLTMKSTPLTFSKANKELPAYEWSFSKRSSGVTMETRIWYYNWIGKGYAVMIRCPSLTRTYQVDKEWAEIIHRQDLVGG